MRHEATSDEEIKLLLDNSARTPSGYIDLSNSNFAGKKFKDMNLCRVSFDNCNLEESMFENVNLSFSSFKSANLKKAKFVDCNLYRTDLSYSDLTEAKSNSRMLSVNLKRANIMNCDFFRSNLEDANFSFAQNTKKKPQIGKIYELAKDFAYGMSVFNQTMIKDNHGMIIAVHKDNTFDILCSEKILRNIPAWANYSLLGKKITE